MILFYAEEQLFAVRAFNLLAASSKCCSGMLNITCVLLNWLLILLSE
tara:strand:- start:944 stop:1084 length:141 start_codon:yes stop_codon:yes gene_type:complete